MERVLRRGARSAGPSGGVAQSNVDGTLRAAVSDVSEGVFFAVKRMKAGRCEARDVAGETAPLGAMRRAARMVGD